MLIKKSFRIIVKYVPGLPKLFWGGKFDTCEFERTNVLTVTRMRLQTFVNKQVEMQIYKCVAMYFCMEDLIFIMDVIRYAQLNSQ